MGKSENHFAMDAHCARDTFEKTKLEKREIKWKRMKNDDDPTENEEQNEYKASY